ncbi:MAG: PAS domain S-box protein [Magnetococcales bacterium]|nr:PAS domain S-box protein [Magnetococcales bacterium]
MLSSDHVKRQKKICDKILALVGTVSFLVLFGLLIIYSQHQSNNFVKQKKEYGQKLTTTAIYGLRSVMLTGSASVAATYAENLKLVPEVIHFEILRIDGTEAFRDNSTIDAVNFKRGSELFPYRKAKKELSVISPQNKHLKKMLATHQTVTFQSSNSPDDKHFMEFLTPIISIPQCQRCHGHETELLGLVYVQISLDSELAVIKSSRNKAIVISIVALITILFLTNFYLRKGIEKPLNEVCQTITKIEKGDLTQRIPLLEGSELWNMANSFNQMVTNLSDSYSRLDRSRVRIETIMDNVGEGIITTNMKGKIESVNPAICHIFGYEKEELLHKNIKILIPSPTKQIHDKLIAKYVHWHSNNVDNNVLHGVQGELFFEKEVVGEKKGGEHFPIELTITHVRSGDFVQFIATIRDITHKKESENQLRQYAEKLEHMVEDRTKQLIHAERLATLGTFSAGIAHEINNPNSFIFGNIQFLNKFWDVAKPIVQKNSHEDKSGRISNFIEEIEPTLHGILDGSKRISKIVDSLKTYSKGGMEMDKVECLVIDPLQDAKTLLRHRIKPDYSIQFDIPDDLIMYCDRQQITQVFVNLLNNSIDAFNNIDSNDNLKIRIAAKLKDKHIWIWVRDNGPGIPESQLGRIFDPFFTTKGKTKGTGLGLSIVEGIIEDHRGQITVTKSKYSWVKTEFTIILPSLNI